MNASLARFQNQFSNALTAATSDAAAAACALAHQPGFAVYRNTVHKGCIDALQANYPAVARLVGEAWFRAAAAQFVRAHPASDARMLRYGARFAEFLAGFEPAAELPYLPDVARLDRFWSESHGAADAPALAPAHIAGLAPEALQRCDVAPHPAARWAWFPDQPIYSIWKRNREARGETAELAWCAEGALLTRPGDAVVWSRLDAAGCAFLDACATGGCTFGDAAAAALRAQGDANLADMAATLFNAGALVAPSLNNATQRN